MAESTALRRRTMQAVRSKNTAPELCVRRLLHAHGYRYRLHKRDLPGAPDVVFPSRNKVIFVHGCSWHGHDCTRGRRVPKTNTAYWTVKVARNRVRDEACLRELRALHWGSLVVWQCQLRDGTSLARRLRSFLGPHGAARSRSQTVGNAAL
jgi:DNA mismatch endonuclease (patch repair protein)